MLTDLAEHAKKWPLRRVISPEGLAAFGEPFAALTRGVSPRAMA
jgi:hypothetical protein